MVERHGQGVYAEHVALIYTPKDTWRARVSDSLWAGWGGWDFAILADVATDLDRVITSYNICDRKNREHR